MTHRIFLGHVGEDHELAASLTSAVEHGLASRDVEVCVFNTSDDRHRFPEVDLGDDWGTADLQRVFDYGAALKEYLASSLSESVAYLLLVTRRSLDKNSGWVAFEAERAAQCDTPFIPCLANGLTWQEIVRTSYEDSEHTEIQRSRWMPRLNLPWRMARDRVMFDVTSDDGLQRLVEGLQQMLSTESERNARRRTRGCS